MTINTAAKPLVICVFCAANDWPEKYTEPSAEFARLLAERGHDLAYGGSNSGLMRLVATTVQAGGSKVIGVPLNSLKEGLYEAADEIVAVETLAERKAAMLERSDAVVVLVGGSGTLDEATDVIEHRRHGLHNKPIIFINSDGFYSNLRKHYERIEAEGLLAPHTVESLIQFVDTPLEAIDLVEESCASKP